MTNNPLVSISFINCNRLFYLKSCVESFLECTQDYPEKELMIIDNASVEPGTEEYLKEKEEQGFKVFRQTERDPNNEFAKALNLTCEEANGEFIIPLQSDMQFIIKGGWLKRYVDLYSQNRTIIGCMTLDVQRKITISKNKYTKESLGGDYKFFPVLNTPPILGAGDAVFSKEIIEMIYPWETSNLSHEGGNDSETKMLLRVQKLIEAKGAQIISCAPVVPPAIAIYTDPRGCNARVRGNRRYGKYVESVENNQYYKYIDFEEALELSAESDEPIGIEFMAEPIGFEKMLDDEGNWLKNPIRPSETKSEDWVEL